jgi:hypothetical protein
MTYHGGQHKPVVEAMFVDFEYADVETGHESDDGNGHDASLDNEQCRSTMLRIVMVWLWPCSHHLWRRVAHDVVVCSVVTFTTTVCIVCIWLRQLNCPDQETEQRERPAAAEGGKAGGSSL